MMFSPVHASAKMTIHKLHIYRKQTVSFVEGDAYNSVNYPLRLPRKH